MQTIFAAGTVKEKMNKHETIWIFKRSGISLQDFIEELGPDVCRIIDDINKLKHLQTAELDRARR